MIIGEKSGLPVLGKKDSIGKYYADKYSAYCKGVKNERTRGDLGILLENEKRWMLNEETRGINIGDFQKYAFPLVRAIFPELASASLVSVQPMLGPTSQVFYLDYVYASSKGRVKAGTKAFDSVQLGPSNPNYSSDKIDEEQVGSGDGADTTPTLTNMSFLPVTPGSVVITSSDVPAQVVTDDGNGNLKLGASTVGTVNYSSGAIAITYGTAPALGPILATYSYDLEAQPNISEIDLVLSSAPVFAKIRKLRSKWSVESAFNLRSLHGLDIETELVAALGSEIRYEIDREVINDLTAIVPSTTQAFPGQGNLIPAWSQSKVFNPADGFVAATGATDTGVSYTEHKLSIIDAFINGDNRIFKSTGRARATWLLCGISVANIIETLPGFVSTPGLPNGLTKGVYKSGVLNTRWDIFKDPFFNDNLYLMGYKGSSFLETGYIYAPYIPLYATPTIMLDDFIARKGLATQYGKKSVNSLFYAKGQIVP